MGMLRVRLRPIEGMHWNIIGVTVSVCNRLDPLRNLWDFPVSYSTEPYGETIQHP